MTVAGVSIPVTQIYYTVEISTHFSLVPHTCVSELGQHWLRQWLVSSSAPSHHHNLCWLILNWTPGKKTITEIRIEIIFIKIDACEIVVCQNGGHYFLGEMSYRKGGLARPQSSSCPIERSIHMNRLLPSMHILYYIMCTKTWQLHIVYMY